MESGTDTKASPKSVRKKAATVAGALRVMQGIQNTRQYYPDVFTESECRHFWDTCRQIIDRYLGHPDCHLLRGLVSGDFADRPEFDYLSEAAHNNLALAVAIALTFVLPKDWNVALEASEAFSNQLESVWRDAMGPEAASIGEELQRLCCARCILPNANTFGGQLPVGRVAFLLNRHEGIVLRLATETTKVGVHRVPLSVTPLLLMLQTRVRACVEAFPELATQNSPTEWFLEVMLSGDFDQFSIEEYTTEQLQKMTVAIERRKIEYATLPPKTTFAEESFFRMADAGVEHYEAEVRENKQRFDAYLNSLNDSKESKAPKGEMSRSAVPNEVTDEPTSATTSAKPDDLKCSERASVATAAITPNDAEDAQEQAGTYDQYFFWLWHSGRETPLPFARVRDISPTEAEWLHDFLWQKADNYFLVDMSKEDSLNAHNLNAGEFIDGFRVVGKGEAEVHRSSLRECISEKLMHEWLELCDQWPKGEWEHLPADWQGEDIYRWVDELHDWSEQAVVELKQARLHTGDLIRPATLNDGPKVVSSPSEPPPISDAIQQPLNESHRPKRAGVREQKLTKALSHIREKGPICGASVASYIGVDEKTFRKHYVPDLKKSGVKNDGAGGDGYYLPDRST